MPTASLIAAVIAFVVSLIGTRVAMVLAERWRFRDVPGREAHKQHAAPVPYGGGLAMAFALALSITVAWWLDPHTVTSELLMIYAGAVVLLGVGHYDDRRPMRAWQKLVIQGGVAAVVVPYGDLQIDSLHAYPVLSYGLAWAWMVLITNAFNLLDHADGLSGSVTVVSAAVLLSGSLMAFDFPLAQLWLVLIATVLGFLAWNLPPARIYMGDAGSMMLGFLIAAGTLTVVFWPSGSGSGSQLAVLSPLVITAVPLFDTAVVIVRRLRSHRPILQGDRNHISHRLNRLGLSPRTALAVVVALQTALAVSVLQLRSGDWLTGAIVLVQDVAIVIAVILLETIRDPGHQR